MEAVDDFSDALMEVEILLGITRSCEPTSPNRPILVKSGLLLLTAKIECFFESVVEEYCEMECRRASSSALPESVRIHAARKIVLECGIADSENIDSRKARDAFLKIAKIWGETSPCPRVEVDAKFSYGKHGEEQVRRLFRRIGIDDVFSECLVEDASESLAAVAGPTSVAADFNSLTHLRNNIVHSDATPAVTEEDLEKYRTRFVAFAKKLEARLVARLGNALLTNPTSV